MTIMPRGFFIYADEMTSASSINEVRGIFFPLFSASDAGLSFISSYSHEGMRYLSEEMITPPLWFP